MKGLTDSCWKDMIDAKGSETVPLGFLADELTVLHNHRRDALEGYVLPGVPQHPVVGIAPQAESVRAVDCAGAKEKHGPDAVWAEISLELRGEQWFDVVAFEEEFSPIRLCVRREVAQSRPRRRGLRPVVRDDLVGRISGVPHIAVLSELWITTSQLG